MYENGSAGKPYSANSGSRSGQRLTLVPLAGATVVVVVVVVLLDVVVVVVGVVVGVTGGV
jgi:hypothetical protein